MEPQTFKRGIFLFDGEDNLASLYNQDKKAELLHANDVASCVKFIELKPDPHEEDEVIRVQLDKSAMRGLKVNLIAGATGAGKTSLIQIMAGGDPTEPKLCSDTKCPTVYIITYKGVKYGILDTAGLCDTNADAGKDVGMQELLINAIAATVKQNRLEIVNFSMCISRTDRMPGKFAEVWPTMQMGLGGDRLMQLGRFVVTKANADSPSELKCLRKLNASPLWQALAESSLQWPVISAGRQNLDDIAFVMKPVHYQGLGVGFDSVDADVESIQSKEKKVGDLKEKMVRLKYQMESKESNKESFMQNISEMQDELKGCAEELASVGWCNDEAKEPIKRKIQAKQKQLSDMQDQANDGKTSLAELQKEMKKWKKEVDDAMNDIAKMKCIGAAFKSFAASVMGR